jgi:predicted unusual protein kinase regulating ubiquinone biosynthesis (AarF/ABC1/UbiB family)
MKRLIHILGTVTRHLFLHVVHHSCRRCPGFAMWVAGSRLSRAERARALFQDLGGAFVKFGQVLALQVDVLPREYCDALMGLLDEGPPFPLESVRDTFAEDLGSAPEKLFDYFDPNPFATGSIGQVHLAQRGSRKLAVKIRCPSVESTFGMDVRLVTFIVELITVFNIRTLHWMIVPMREFIAWSSDELDYLSEAQHAEELGACSRRTEMIPKVLWEYTSKRILTLDYVEGLTVLDYLRRRDNHQNNVFETLSEAGFVPSCFARNVIRDFLENAFGNGIFHADPHPGNLVIKENNEVGYVDFGICGTLSQHARQHLSAMTLAYSTGDSDGLCASFTRVCALESTSNILGFRTDVEIAIGQWQQAKRELNSQEEGITSRMLQLFTISRRNGLWPNSEVVKYIRAAITLDGVMKLLDPSLSVARELETILFKHPDWIFPQFVVSPSGVVSCGVLDDDDRYLIRREFLNLASAVQHFELDKARDARKEAERPRDEISTLVMLDAFHALWAIEGYGFSEAESAWKAHSEAQLKIACSCRSLPSGGIAAVHVGRSLSCASQFLKLVGVEQTTEVGLLQFFELCEANSPEGCGGIATEALGFVARTLHHEKLQEIAEVISSADSKLLPYYWHGVGRAIYFLYPRALYPSGGKWVGLRHALGDAIYDDARDEVLSGFAWPLVLVNIRHPEILALFVEQHGEDLSDYQFSFAGGVATSVLLWATWAGCDKYLRAFRRFEPSAMNKESRQLWAHLISNPCMEVTQSHVDALRASKRYGELFHHQSLHQLTNQLTRLTGTDGNTRCRESQIPIVPLSLVDEQ